MKPKAFLLYIAMVFSLFVSCEQEPPTDLAKTAFIPKPVSVTASGDRFKISDKLTIYYNEDSENLETTAQLLATELNRISGLNLQVQPSDELPRSGIYLSAVSESAELGREGYELNIGNKLISVQGATPAGIFYGIQTLLQTIPVKNNAGSEIIIPAGTIRDFPEYDYRGAMLDVARHFFTVEEVKRFIDYLAMYKLNALHLHLSDDQGWRIEIKSWPKLTEIGGSTEVGGGPGGYYTQEEYKDLVDYAQQRNVIIVPEIDMPGHTNAALASYAELNCDGKTTELYTGTKVGFSTLCTDKEITYEFIDDVFRELAAITPGPYLHMGGDESHVTPLEDYIPFVERVQEIALKYDKKIIGWDEIANAKLVEDATVQFWDNLENTRMGLEQNAQVLISPAKKAYLDMQYDSTSTYGLHWAGYIEVDNAYKWDPLDQVPGISKEQILGIEAPLWSETVSNIDEAEYLVFPRLPGYAEIGWTATEAREWEDYKTRLAKHGQRFDDLGIDFYPSDFVPWENKE